MIGKQLAHYEVLGLLGRGGMGEVYRARDTKLDREVALKLLPTELASDPERLARFRREAKVLASLNHPNIAGIHGLEEADGKSFLVMELAEGEDLSLRMRQGPLSAEETGRVALQIAEGLEEAHEKGIVHRDLKPANVKVSDDGKVKILDFGLARAYAGEPTEESDPATSPTITAAMTQAGVILGTAAYMSPEQARGRSVDRRADIWAFGVILYEMLTGTRLFEGETVSDTLAGVLKTEPDLELLPEDTPIALRWLVERCLQKQPAARLRDIGEARILLQSDLDQPPPSTLTAGGVVIEERPRWMLPALIGVALLAGAIGAIASFSLRPAPPAAPVVHATLLAPDDQRIEVEDGGHLALSPDGQRLAFVASDSGGQSHLWVRRIDRAAPHQLSGTLGASYPFWSPDGEKIGFFADGKLKKIDAAGGVATSICDASRGRGGGWTPDGRIVFPPGPRTGLQIVSASGGEPRWLTRADSVGWSHRWPRILPDGRHYIFTTRGNPDRILWAALDDSNATRVLLRDAMGGGYADGHLFFGRDGALWARPLDPERGEFLGEETLVADAVVSSDNFGGAVYSASTSGTLVYAAGQQNSSTTLALYDRTGEQLESFDFGAAFADDLTLSRDGRYLAVALFPAEGNDVSDIWIRDLQRRTLSRLTTEEAVDDPVWSPEGERIIYSARGDLRIRSVRGAREVLLELPFEEDALPHDWSRDGRYVLYSLPGSGRSIWLLPVDDPEARRPIVLNEHFNVHPSFSPDGEWITYMSVETGDAQVYLRSIDEDGDTWQVSSGIAVQPRFGEDGNRLYYLTQRGLSTVEIRWTERGPELGSESLLFEVPYRSGRYLTHQYCILPGEQQFLFVIDPDRSHEDRRPLELVVGWQSLVEGE